MMQHPEEMVLSASRPNAAERLARLARRHRPPGNQESTGDAEDSGEDSERHHGNQYKGLSPNRHPGENGKNYGRSIHEWRRAGKTMGTSAQRPIWRLKRGFLSLVTVVVA